MMTADARNLTKFSTACFSCIHHAVTPGMKTSDNLRCIKPV